MMLNTFSSYRTENTACVHRKNQSVNMGVQPFHSNGPHPVLWGGLRAARGKITRKGIPLLYFTPRRYNPCRILADSRSRLQSSLSLALALQFLTPDFPASFVTPSIHLRFGLPARLLPSSLSKVIFLHGRLSCICITCPAHLRLPN